MQAHAVALGCVLKKWIVAIAASIREWVHEPRVIWSRICSVACSVDTVTHAAMLDWTKLHLKPPYGRPITRQRAWLTWKGAVSYFKSDSLATIMIEGVKMRYRAEVLTHENPGSDTAPQTEVKLIKEYYCTIGTCAEDPDKESESDAETEHMAGQPGQPLQQIHEESE